MGFKEKEMTEKKKEIRILFFAKIFLFLKKPKLQDLKRWFGTESLKEKWRGKWKVEGQMDISVP